MSAIKSAAVEMATNATKAASPIHPYYPLDVEIVGYLANQWPVPTLLGVFFGGLGVIFYSTHVLVKRQNPHMPKGELLTVMWFVLCKETMLSLDGEKRLMYDCRRLHPLFL